MLISVLWGNFEISLGKAKKQLRIKFKTLFYSETENIIGGGTVIILDT